jgi:hypothetical protein
VVRRGRRHLRAAAAAAAACTRAARHCPMLLLLCMLYGAGNRPVQHVTLQTYSTCSTCQQVLIPGRVLGACR